jgi:phosphatidylserine/phosphatidylglycerophosphate/cardiolipin synthase-like enzyme
MKSTNLAICSAAILAIWMAPAYAWKPRSTLGEDLTQRNRSAASTQSIAATGTIEVAFSPNGGATSAVLQAIQEARRTIRVSAYYFTSNAVANALLAAHKRGVDVQMVVDRDHNGTRSNGISPAGFLAANGVPVRIDFTHKIQHQKVMVIDTTVQLGSFNYTTSAELSNSENVLVFRGNPQLANTFMENWQRLWDVSKPLQASY